MRKLKTRPGCNITCIIPPPYSRAHHVKVTGQLLTLYDWVEYHNRLETWFCDSWMAFALINQEYESQHPSLIETENNIMPYR